MAFNINITKKENVDFEELNSLCSGIDRFYVTIFPITKSVFQKQEGIGLSINIKADYSEFWKDFEPFLITLFEKKYQVVELYDGIRINQDNITDLKNMLTK
jgi:hypothetical protein